MKSSPCKSSMKAKHKRHDKYAKSCYQDQVSSISSYRCKRNHEHCSEDRPASALKPKENATNELWLNLIARKENDIKSELDSGILVCRQSLKESNEKLSLTLDQSLPFLKAARRLHEYLIKRTLMLAWTRLTSRLDEIRLDAKKSSAAVVLQSEWRRILKRRQFAATMLIIIRIQCFARQRIARRRLGGLKKKRNEALLLREQFVRKYVAGCRRRKRKEHMLKLSLVRENALRVHIARYRRRKLLELEHS